MKKDKALKIAESVLEQVGGKQNIAKVLHCQTRLRFNLKDESIANHEKIEAVQGVLGVVRAGGQVQIVIGPEAVSYTHLDKLMLLQHGSNCIHINSFLRSF